MPRSLLPLVLLTACGELPPPLSERPVSGCIDGSDGSTIEQGRVDHACLHTQAGPFAFVETALSPLPLPELRHTHTAYTLGLARTEAGHVGSVMVKPRQPAVFAFYSQPDVEITVKEQARPEICPVARGAVGDCPRLAAVRAFALDAGYEYVLSFGPVAAATVLVVVEAETAAQLVDAAPP